MISLKAFLRLLGRIVHAFTRSERMVVLLLAGVFFASLGQLFIATVETPNTQEKGLYTEGLVGQVKLLNPLFVDFNDVDRDIGALLFSGLVKYDPLVQNFVPDLAEFERSEDDTTYRFTLKKDLFWHDGKPVTADDVYFTFHDVIQDPGFKNTPLRRAFEGIEIKKVDAKTITFTLPKPNSFFISYLTTGMLFEGQNQIQIEAFDLYYAEKARIGTIRFLLFSDFASLIENHSSLHGIARIRGEEFLKEIPDDRFTRYTYTLPQSVSVFFNLARPFTKQKHIRQALMKAVDKDLIVQNVGASKRIDRLYFSQAQNEWIHTYNATEAKKILEDLGWKMKDDGFRHNNTDQILTLTLLSKRFPEGSPIEDEMKLVTDMLRNFYQTVGIHINVQRESGDTFNQFLEKREYDLLLTGQSLGYNFDTYSFWHSTQRGSGKLNFSELQSFRVDSLLENIQTVFDSKRKKQKMDQLEQLISEEIPALFLYQPVYTYAIDKRVSGFSAGNLSFSSDRFSHFTSLVMKKR
ncbi:MAG: Oligopeptide ABC transporter substrate-binding protein [Candidatus Peregrinibacteria bacterium GW2011_GWA2_47_7]|nr:MAG: Oligopeptide ABC transporter substrate-binding protein [Candidatus Peregrinibacteria bacterium GW2011_GWA2_47_7]